MFLCVPVFVLDRTLRNVMSSERLRTSSDIIGPLQKILALLR